MHSTNRDLLVLLNEDLLSPQAIEHQVELLHEMLFKIESFDNLCIAHEILDLNRYKKTSRKSIIKEHLKKKKEVPFVFLSNKN